MRWIWYIVCTISCFWHTNVQSQNISQTLNLAQALFSENKYHEAASLYKRALFFSDITDKTNIALKMAQCYEFEGNMQQAARYYSYAVQPGISDSLMAKAVFSKVRVLINLNRYKEAELELISFANNNINIEQEKSFYLGAIYFLQNEHNISKEHWQNWLSASTNQEINALNNLFGSVNKIKKRYNPNIAKYLSIGLPGSGQIYAGNVPAGLNSLALVAVFLSMHIYFSYAYSFFDSMVLIYPWYYRYFAGGYMQAEKLCTEKRDKELIKIYNQLLILLASTTKQ